MDPQKKMTNVTTSCLHYFEDPLIVELISGSFGDDEQSLRIFKTFLAKKEDTTGFFSFEKILPLMIKDTDPPLAALKGRFSVVEWLFLYLDIDEDKEVCMKMCEKAAEGGHMEILQWLHGVGCPSDVSTSTAAARHGNMQCLQWIVARSSSILHGFGARIMIAAAEGGHLDILKWLRGKGCRWNREIVAIAARNGHIDCLKWAHENGGQWYRYYICAFAAEGGSLDALQWARENGCPWDNNTCSNAAKNGHIDCLKWARDNGCPWDEDTCRYAAENGHLECLKWARENGCPWDENTCRFAAANGHQDCLDWARENGCPEN